MRAPIEFHVFARCDRSRARFGRIETPHGWFDTPAFIPVGTRGTVKGLLPESLRQVGAQIVLANTMHLMLRPGSELVKRLGGLHAFSGWAGPMLTDSGGYQAFSLSATSDVTDEGVTFRSIVDGSRVELSPERAMRVQNELGADIIMPLDDCPPAATPRRHPRAPGDEAPEPRPMSPEEYARRLDVAGERTVRWLERCVRAHARPREQALFGIVQGGTDPGRRTDSARRITAIDLPGYAIGGVAVGESTEEIARIVGHTAPLLPEDRPRYLMGVGLECDLVAAVRAGVDMFDCVLPTRNGRSASAFTTTGQIRLRNARFAEDPGPLDEACDCPVCRPADNGWRTPGGRPFSRAYVRHLFMAGEMLGPILVSLHNVRHFQRLMMDIRQTIRDHDWPGFARRWPVARSAALGGALPAEPGATSPPSTAP